MNLGEYAELASKAGLGEMPLSNVPLNHPKTGEKIFLKSQWNAGFWYTKVPDQEEGQVFPCQYYGQLKNLILHEDSEELVASLQKTT